MRSVQALLGVTAIALAAVTAREAAGQDGAAPAAPPGSSLAIEEVVSGAVARHPSVIAALKDRDVAAGEVLAAEGGFDPVWRTRAMLVPVGYYDTQRLDTVVSQPTPFWGTNFFAGYRIGTGNFAVYDGKAQTLDRGEFRAGAAIPLWRDGPIDNRRAALWSANLAPKIADAGVAAQKLEIARAAAIRYWNWVEAGRAKAVGEGLLALAEARDEALAERVSRGDLAAIERQDNQRVILGRRNAVVQLERAFLATSYELSIFLRDPAGAAVTPTASRLPQALPEPRAVVIGSVESEVAKAITKRPELLRLAAQREQIEIEARLAANQARPAVDLQGVVSKDVGNGPYSLRPAEIEIGVLIDIPLLARTAKGKNAQAVAKGEKLDAQRKLLEDRISADVRDALAQEAAARARIDLARAEVRLARTLAEAERDAFTLGQSTILILNLREQAVAEAELKELAAVADHHRAVAVYRAATGDLGGP
jgi:outer membrane protein TolC